MGIDIEFLVPFNEGIVTDTRYDKLEDILTLPVRISSGTKIARALPSGAASPDGKMGVRFTIPGDMDVDWTVSDNIAISRKEDPPVAISKVDGYLCARDGRLTITQICEIFGDVGPKTGNLSLPDSILVHGDVNCDYKVESEKDIEVRGLVERAQLRAGGNVTLKGGVMGEKKGAVTAGGDIRLTFAQQCRLTAEGSIVANGILMDCETYAGSSVTLKGRGALVGGITRARTEVNAITVGSEGAAPTEIELGYNPFEARIREEITNKQKNMRRELETKRKEISFAMNKFREELQYDPSDMMSAIMSMSELARDGTVDGLAPDKREMFRRLGSALLDAIYLKEAVTALETSKQTAADLAEYPTASLKADKIAHPGVKITILDGSLHLDTEFERVKFELKEGQVTPVWL